MPENPQIIPLSDSLRLRKYDGNFALFLPAYQDPYIYQNSEGIFDENKKPDLDYVRRMCAYLAKTDAFYYIEAKEDGRFIPIGDVTIKPENPPIAIWLEKYRGIGIGKQVMRFVIDTLRAQGHTHITGSTVYKWNIASQRLHESLGFCKSGENETETFYSLTL